MEMDAEIKYKEVYKRNQSRLSSSSICNPNLWALSSSLSKSSILDVIQDPTTPTKNSTIQIKEPPATCLLTEIAKSEEEEYGPIAREIEEVICANPCDERKKAKWWKSEPLDREDQEVEEMARTYIQCSQRLSVGELGAIIH